MKAEGRVLNLGCGNMILAYAINHDLMKREGVDEVWDLNVLPWPWEDNSFDYVIAKAVLEHLQHDLLTSMNELWRILAPEGIVEIKLPYWKSEASYNDLTHRYVYGLGIFDGLDPDTKRGRMYGFYTERKWRILYPPILNKSVSCVSCRLKVRKNDSVQVVGNGEGDQAAHCGDGPEDTQATGVDSPDSRPDAPLSGDGLVLVGPTI